MIVANRSGLRSLARHFLTLADEATPDGRHLDIDDYTGWFIEGSLGIRIEVDDSMVYMSQPATD
jgi:hypothetical protein